MMSELFDEHAQREEYNIARDREVKAEGIAEGMAKGRIEGRAEGRAEGITEGVVKGKLDVALNLLALGTISKEDIAKETCLSIEKIKELAVQ